MLKDVLFISMEGKTNFKINDFTVREDVSLPVHIPEGQQFSMEHITPENIISGMIRVISDDPDNENIDYYREFIFSVQPDIEEMLTSVAYEAERNHHFNDALEIYRVLRALKPYSLDHNLNIAVCYDEYSQYLFHQGHEDDAVKLEDQAYQFYKIVDEFEEKNDRAYYYLGRFYLIRENYDKAVEYFKEFVNISDDDERKREVIELLTQIADEGLKDDDYQMAVSLIQSDKDKDAIDFINKYIEKYPDSWNGYFLKGRANRKLEAYSTAIKFFERAEELNPGSPDIYNEMGLCYMNLKIFNKSELCFSKALKSSPDDIAIIHNLALCSFKKGDKEEALKYCEVILEFNKNDAETKKLKKFIEESDN